MTEEYPEEFKWGMFWTGLNATSKGGSITQTFFQQLYSFRDEDGERTCSYKVNECRIRNHPKDIQRTYEGCDFYLDVDSIIPGNDKFRIHTANTTLDQNLLVLPQRDLRLIRAVKAAFSDFTLDECFIPSQVLEKVTRPIQETLARLKQK